MGRDRPLSDFLSARPLRSATILKYAAAGAFLLVLAARLHVIARIGTALPFWDEWDRDVISLFLPPTSLHPSATLIFSYHNEHLIALTRLLDLSLFWIAQGQIHVVSNAVLNQIAYTAFAIVVLLALGRGLSTWARLALVTIGGAVFANPFGWEAIGWAFESQIYICIVLSVTSFALIARYNPDQPGFWCAMAAAAGSVLSFAVGEATILIVIALIVARNWRHPYVARAATAATLLAVVLTLSIVSTPYGNDLHASQGVGHLIETAVRVMSWPGGYRLPLFVYLPSLLLTGAGVARQSKRNTFFWFATAILLWETIIAAQIALGRPNEPTVSRYTELLTVGVAVNLACAFHLMAAAPPSCSKLFTAAAVAWIGLMSVAYDHRVPALQNALADKRGLDDGEEYGVARFLKTGDRAALWPPNPLLYHNPNDLAQSLNQGQANHIFPASILNGDTPQHAKWRKTLNRYAEASAIIGALLLLTTFLITRRRANE
jgi:hypothetical protein